MKRIKNYLLLTIMVLTPALLLAHPGHEHQGTGLELLAHFLITSILITGIVAGVYQLTQYFLRRKRSAADNRMQS